MTATPMTLPASPMREALALCAAPLESVAAAVADGQRGPDSWQRTYVFPASALVFAGHFPGHPVLPAVVQTLMAQMTVEDALAQSLGQSTAQSMTQNMGSSAVPGGSGAPELPPLRLVAVTQAKFTAVLTPDTPIAVRVRPAAKAQHWDCTLHSLPRAAQGESTLAAKIQLHLEQGGPALKEHA